MAEKKKQLKEKKKNTENQEEIKAENKETESNFTKEKENSQIYWTIGIMISLILVFLISYYIFHSLRNFEYEDIKFSKEKFGELDVYRHSYLIKNLNGEDKVFTLYLRLDPRENKVPVEEEIEFRLGNKAYISVNSTGLLGCPYSAPAIGSLSSFLAGNGFEVNSAVPDEQEAREIGVPFADCSFTQNRNVIIIESGESTEITKTTDYCYNIKVNNCEILDAIEKFEVQSIIDARARNNPSS